MSTTTRPAAHEEIEYPESDGEPMAENTEQFDWITLIKGNLDCVFRDDPNVFVAGDLLWYPVEGNDKIRRAPDVMVALGRPKGRRGSYLQWLEGGIAPQVVFEILSPGNRGEELARKFAFYETYGVEEYYIYDPDFHTLEGWLRAVGTLRPIPAMDGWTSPGLGIRFEHNEDQFRLYRPDGRPFLTRVELGRQVEEVQRRADAQQQRADAQQRQLEEQGQQLEAERQRADAERQRAEEQQRLAQEQQHLAQEQQGLAQEQQRRAERLAAQLKALGIEPEP
jgi:Uma2 family endonuclease